MKITCTGVVVKERRAGKRRNPEIRARAIGERSLIPEGTSYRSGAGTKASVTFKTETLALSLLRNVCRSRRLELQKFHTD